MLVTSRNVYVKIKVLRLLQCLVEEGHIEFKQNMRKQPEPINEASKLRPINPKDSKIAAECGRIRDMATVSERVRAETEQRGVDGLIDERRKGEREVSCMLEGRYGMRMK